MNVQNTVKDVSRSIARLDENAKAREADVINIDGENWTGLDLRMSVATCLGSTIGRQVRLTKITKRDVGIMMAAHGASTMTIQDHAGPIMRLIKADFALHTWGGWL